MYIELSGVCVCKHAYEYRGSNDIHPAFFEGYCREEDA